MLQTDAQTGEPAVRPVEPGPTPPWRSLPGRLLARRAARQPARRKHRSPVPGAVFAALLAAGAVLDVVLWRTRVWVDLGVLISFGAMWLAGWIVVQATWDYFLAPRHWIEHEPRLIPLPWPLDRSKRFWPLIGFLVGIWLGHVWWW